MNGFLEALEEQRWDDHRYYHHSRINQSLHCVSALCFLCSYVLIFTSPVAAALVGWALAMVSRQVGHFFFEPKGYDEVNEASFDHKEDIKVGYNLRRKQILLTIWALLPLVVYFSPTVFGRMDEYTGWNGFMHHVSVLWLFLGAGALIFRVVQLCFERTPQTGIVWLVKIITDPFHDLKIYHRAPWAVLRGELIAPHHGQMLEHGSHEHETGTAR